MLTLAITSLISTSEVHLAVSFGSVLSDVELVPVNYEADLLLHELFDKRNLTSASTGTL